MTTSQGLKAALQEQKHTCITSYPGTLSNRPYCSAAGFVISASFSHANALCWHLLCQLILLALCHHVSHCDIPFVLWNFMPISLLLFIWVSNVLYLEIWAPHSRYVCVCVCSINCQHLATWQMVGAVSISSADYLFERKEHSPPPLTPTKWLVLSK